MIFGTEFAIEHCIVTVSKREETIAIAIANVFVYVVYIHANPHVYIEYIRAAQITRLIRYSKLLVALNCVTLLVNFFFFIR